MNYGEILVDSFKVFWKHRSLWIYGIIAALFGQTDFRFNAGFRQPGLTTRGRPPMFDPNDLANLPFFANFFQDPIPYILGIVILAIILALLFNMIGWFSKGAIIGMVAEIEQTGATSLRSGWKAGKQHALPLFLISLILGIPQMILALPLLATLVVGIIIFFGNYLGNPPGIMPEQFIPANLASVPVVILVVALACGLACINGLLNWLLGILKALAARSCVLENLGVTASLRRGWQVGIKDIRYPLLNGIVVVVLGAIVGVISSILVMTTIIPIAAMMFAIQWTGGIAIIMTITAVILLVILIFFSGLFTAFTNTLWTKFYKGLLQGQQPIV